ncbi:MAG: leucine-rich repeat protein [Lachnospiraceae bacterium]|nr:leucine-rich repeat protein [Lachnospiraceae bacterium]
MRKKISRIICLLQAAVLVIASPCVEVMGEGLLSEEVILEEEEVTEAFSNDPVYDGLIIEDGLIEDPDGEEPELEQDGFQRPEVAGDMQETETELTAQEETETEPAAQEETETELTAWEETETQEEENLDQALGNEEGLLSDASETGAAMEGEAGEGEEDEIIKVITDTEIYINPEYAGIIRESDLNHPAAVDIPSVGKVHYAASIEAAGADMRSQLKKRQETITIHYKISRDEYYGSLVWDIFDAAFAHTGVPTEGDYLRPQYGGSVVRAKYQISKRFYYCDFTYTMTYFTNAAQEAAVDRRIAQVMASLNLAGKSEYGKIKAIYDYICGNVKYDHEHGEDYKLRYTAYAALIDGSAVCNGYAVLFYRMALEAGLSTRYVSGYTASDGSGSHAWNIVRINGLYYNLDSTWDAGSKNYKWFLRSPADFTSHYRAERYIAANFNGQYPMSSQNYSLEGTMQAETSGKCGTNLTWSLDQNGVLKIQGTGKMTDYSDAQPAPWNGQDVRKVLLSSGVGSVGSRAFCYFENLTAVTLPASVKTIGSFAFSNCKGLSGISLPSGLTSIGESAFAGCTGLSALSIPGGVKSIGANAFRGASGLRSVVLADGVAGIGQMAFAECGSLESLTFPISAAKGDSSVFGSCWKLTKVELTGTGAIPDYASDKSAPWNRPTVQSVKIRSGITGIGSYAFYQLDSLKSISLPSSVKKIGKEAFAYCDGLTGISIPSSVTAIGESAFKGCSNLSSLTIPVRISGKNTIFSGCGKLTKVDIIGTGAMPECVYAWDRPWWQPSIKTVVIHSGVTSIGRAAFYNLDHLTSVTIPSSVKKIGKEAFAFCDQLTRITIPNGVTEIGEGAFCKCVKLASVSLPSSVKSIGVKAFAWCDSLKSVKLSEKLEKISESSFYLCKNLTSITIPSKVKTIGKEAFAFCYNLANADIPTSVTSIGSNAFVRCTKLKITGYTGSTAYNYAVKNKIPFKSKGFVTPVMKKAESAKDGIKVSWNKVSGAKSYRVYRKNGNGWTIIGDVKSGNTTSYTDKKAKAGTLYTYKVRVCSNGKPVSDYSANSVTGVRMTAPVLSEAKNVTGRKIRVKWKKCAGASGYEIRYTTGSNVKTIKVTKGTTVEKIISGLKKNKTYTVKVRSYKTSGKNTWYSSWSGQKKVVVRK